MKATFSPVSTEEMQAAIVLLERVYRRELGCESHFHMGKLSGAIGDVMFVAQATSNHRLDDVRVVVLEEAARR